MGIRGKEIGACGKDGKGNVGEMEACEKVRKLVGKMEASERWKHVGKMKVCW